MDSYVEIARGELHAKLRDVAPSARSRLARNSSRVSFADSSKTLEYQRSDFKICSILRGITCEINADWFRDAVSNAVRSPSLAARLVLAVSRAGCRQALRIRIGNEHPDSLITYPDVHNLSTCAQPIRVMCRRWGCGAWLRCPWVVAGPGRASRRRAERSSRRGRLAGGPPPTAQHGPAGHAKQHGLAGDRGLRCPEYQRAAARSRTYSCSARPFLTARSRR